VDTEYGPFYIGSKIEVAVIAAQESFISCLYTVESWKQFRPSKALWKKRTGETLLEERTRNLLKYLILSNILIIVGDLTLLILVITTDAAIWGSFKGLLYSVKLKVELYVLNQLKTILTARMKSNISELFPVSSTRAEFSKQSYGDMLKTTDLVVQRTNPSSDYVNDDIESEDRFRLFGSESQHICSIPPAAEAPSTTKRL
jgi:hypothetical protein